MLDLGTRLADTTPRCFNLGGRIMQTLTVAKNILKPHLRSLIGSDDSQASNLLLRSFQQSGDLEGARLALSEAEKVIRAQEERICQL